MEETRERCLYAGLARAYGKTYIWGTAMALDFFVEATGAGPPVHVVSQEIKALSGSSDVSIQHGALDLISFLCRGSACRTLDEAGIYPDVSLTGDPNLFHRVDGLTARTAALFTVNVDSSGNLEDVVVLRFCEAANSLIPTGDIKVARDRLSRFRSKS